MKRSRANGEGDEYLEPGPFDFYELGLKVNFSKANLCLAARVKSDNLGKNVVVKLQQCCRDRLGPIPSKHTGGLDSGPRQSATRKCIPIKNKTVISKYLLDCLPSGR